MNPTKIHVKRLDTCSLIPTRTLRQRTYILGRYTLVCVEGDAHHGPTLQIVKVEAASRRSRRRPILPTPLLNSSEERGALDCPAWPASSTSCRSGKHLARQSYLLLPRIMQASSALHSVSAWEAATAHHHDGGRNSRRSSNNSRGSSQPTRERCRARRCWQPCENAAPETLRRRCSNSSIEAPR